MNKAIDNFLKILVVFAFGMILGYTINLCKTTKQDKSTNNLPTPFIFVKLSHSNATNSVLDVPLARIGSGIR
jgi:hypothetical protein